MARSAEVMRQMPDAERQLTKVMAEALEIIGDIDRVFGNELNEWAANTRERLWMEHFTAEEILRALRNKVSMNESMA